MLNLLTNHSNKYSANSEVVGIGTFSALDNNGDSPGSLAPIIVDTVNGSNNRCLVTSTPTNAVGNLVLIIYQSL